MRLFIAVAIDEAVRAAAGAIIEDLKRSGADVKWVEPENLHLTLIFLGQTREDQLPALKAALAGVAAAGGPFDIVFDRLGAFGAPARPRVLWMGIAAGAQALSLLEASLKAALAAAGVVSAEDEREFSAHLTLGRVRGLRGIKKLLERFKAARFPPGLSCRGERIVLFRSRLSSTGPAYETLCTEPLG